MIFPVLQLPIFCMAGMYCMRDLLGLVLREGATELRLCSGSSPVFVTRGKALTIDAPALTSDELETLLGSIATNEQREELQRCGDVHFIYVLRDSARFSVLAARLGETLTVAIKNLER